MFLKMYTGLSSPKLMEHLNGMKMYTGLSIPKLMEHLNGNVHYQLFCDAREVVNMIILLTYLLT